MNKYYYQPSFSPFFNHIWAKSKKEAGEKLVKAWPEYSKKHVLSWLR